MAYADKTKRREYMKEWRMKNATTERPKVNTRVKLRRIAIRDFVKLAKHNKPCADCGIIYPAHVLDFDHRQGEKSFILSRASVKGTSLDVVQTEINKCDIVCANCHRIRTFERSGRVAQQQSSSFTHCSAGVQISPRLPN